VLRGKNSSNGANSKAQILQPRSWKAGLQVIFYRVRDCGKPESCYTGNDIYCRLLQPLCFDHLLEAQRLSVELPLAIQELHAWGLVFPVGVPERMVKVHEAVAQAVARVVRFRQLEAQLKGEVS
jgi:Zn-dependent alcohol dehydrogenase